MRKPSYVGETSAVLAVINFLMWAVGVLPDWAKWLIVPFGILFVIDWMFGGVSDTGICKKCF